MPAVVAWARGPMAAIFGDCLDDPRVDIKVSDVRRLINGAKASYDAILLDVDNGPDGLTVETNDALYSMAGLKAAKAALRPGGVLAIWASAPDRAFTQRLQRAGFTVEEERVRANGKSRGVPPCHLAGHQYATASGPGAAQAVWHVIAAACHTPHRART